MLQILSAVESLSSTEASRSPSPLIHSHSLSPDFTSLSNRLTAISPLPDMRRDSGCSEDLITLPVPVEFADEEARRRSLIPSDDGDSRSPSFTPSDTELQDLVTSSKTSQKFLSIPSDSVSIDVKDEAKRFLPSKEDKDKGNRLAAGESVQKTFDEQLQLAVSQLHENLSISVSDSGPMAITPPQDVQGEAHTMDLLIISDIQERRSSTVSLKDMEKDMCHIDSPEAMEPEEEDSGLHFINPNHDGDMNLQSEFSTAGFVNVSGMLITPSSTEDDQEVISPLSPKEKSDSDDEEEGKQVVKSCSLAHFEEGNDIARRSFYKHIRSAGRRKKKTATEKSVPLSDVLTEPDNEFLDVVKIQIQGSNSNLSAEAVSTPVSALESHRPSLATCEADDEELCQYHIQVCASVQIRKATHAVHLHACFLSFSSNIKLIVIVVW